MRAQLASQRERSAAADELREAERSEMVASYERMLAEQAAAVRAKTTTPLVASSRRWQMAVLTKPSPRPKAAHAA